MSDAASSRPQTRRDDVHGTNSRNGDRLAGNRAGQTDEAVRTLRLGSTVVYSHGMHVPAGPRETQWRQRAAFRQSAVWGQTVHDGTNKAAIEEVESLADELLQLNEEMKQ